MRTLPNFFIIGAPKAGTTALSEYLREHPQVFFSDPKEPHYFNDDFSARHTYDLDTYIDYFKNACEEHKSIGEGSVFYLYSKTAVKNILKIIPDAKFIVMVRNPLESVPSLHMEAVATHGENILDIKKAWDIQERRMEGKLLPPMIYYKESLYYGSVSKVGDQINRLFSNVSQDKTHVIVFDDFKKNTKTEYLKVLDFLELKDWTPDSFKKINTSRGYKRTYLKKSLDNFSYYKTKLGINRGLGIGLFKKISDTNTVIQKRKPLSNGFKNELVDYFKDDVKLLSKLLNKDLTTLWLQNYED